MSQQNKFLNCENKDLLPVWQLLASCFGVDGSGHVYLRTVSHSVSSGACENNAISCESPEQLAVLLRQSIVLDDCEKPALLLGVVT